MKKGEQDEGAKITKEGIFYYVDGVLHSPEYRARFASDLKKMLPRIPVTRETADLDICHAREKGALYAR